MNKKVKFAFSVLFSILFTLFIFWIFISFININLHNTDINYTYPDWNLFTYFIK